MSKIQKFRNCWWAVFGSLMVVIFTSISVWTYYLETMLTNGSDFIKDALAWTAGGLVLMYILYVLIATYRFNQLVTKDANLTQIRDYLFFKRQKFDNSQTNPQFDSAGLETIWKIIQRYAWGLGMFVTIFGALMITSQPILTDDSTAFIITLSLTVGLIWLPSWISWIAIFLTKNAIF